MKGWHLSKDLKANGDAAISRPGRPYFRRKSYVKALRRRQARGVGRMRRGWRGWKYVSWEDLVGGWSERQVGSVSAGHGGPREGFGL